MNNIIIPVRAGSKGIKNKNLAEVHGVTLLERAIETALSIPDCNVIVSTDGAVIEQVAAKYPVILHQRSVGNAQDFSSTESVIEEVVADFPDYFLSGSIVILLQATSPFVSANSISQCISAAEGGYSGFTAMESNFFLWQQSGDLWEPVGHPTDFRPRRQDRSPQVIETGGCYAFPLDNFQNNKYRFCAAPKSILVSSFEGIDIDTGEDLIFANSIKPTRLKTGVATPLFIPKVIITDFDGCLTDDKVHVNQSGEESVTASRKDGLYIGKIKNLGIPVWVLSSESNPVVGKRANKLEIPFIQGAKTKTEKMQEIFSAVDCSWKDVWYIGNDLNDYEVMRRAGFSLCPADSNNAILSTADVVLSTIGGHGVFQEVFELVKVAKSESNEG
jgi:N-acylneuraminate cytidylyltransferase